MARKPAAKPRATRKTTVLRTEEVAVNDLNLYYKNPRIGDVNMVAESLAINGQYKPIVVNIGTHTGRPNEILAGNHTYLGARKEIQYEVVNGKGVYASKTKEPWDTILASFVDVDEETAKKIVLVDNKSGDASTYDETLLAELVAGVPDLSGTGFTPSEVSDLIAEANKALAESGSSLDDIMAGMPTDLGDSLGQEKKSQRQQLLDEEDEDDKDRAAKRGAPRVDPEADAEIEDFEDVQSELQGLLQLREDVEWPGDNFWQIPELREDMLAESVPERLKTWGGHDATPDDGRQHFFWQYGCGGVKGLPFDRTILSFFTHDEKFEGFWSMPSYYVAKMLNAGIKTAVVPDFSLYTGTMRVQHLWNVYRAQWLGRFFQEAGIKVIPRIQFNTEESLDFSLLGIPKGAPVVAVSMQNLDSPETEKEHIRLLRKALDEVEPQSLIIYGAPKRMERIHAGLNTKIPVHRIENFAGVRRGVAFDNPDGAKGVAKKKAAAKKLAAGKAKDADVDDDE